MKNKVVVFIMCFIFSMLLNCAGYHRITHKLEVPLKQPSNCYIGGITDKRPSDLTDAENSSLDFIYDIQYFLREEISEIEFFNQSSDTIEPAKYEVNGSLIKLEKGSSITRTLLRFFVLGFFWWGPGLGNASLEIELRLVDIETDTVVFAGTFKSSGPYNIKSGDELSKRIARDFSKALKDQLEIRCSPRSRTPSGNWRFNP